MYSHGQSQREMGRFSTTPYSSETPKPIFTKPGIHKYFPHTNFQAGGGGAMSTLVVLANSQLDAWKFLSYFLRLAHGSHLWTHQRNALCVCRLVARRRTLKMCCYRSRLVFSCCF